LIQIQFISKNLVLSEKIRLQSGIYNNVSILFNEDYVFSRLHDVCIMPAVQFLDSASEIKKNTKIQPHIAYGSPVLLLSAFAAGCSDYLKEPWELDELVIRVNKTVEKHEIQIDDSIVSFSKTEIQREDIVKPLSFQEFLVLDVLCKNRGNIVSREVLYYTLWGYNSSTSRVADMHVCSIRRKLAFLAPEHNPSEIIRTVKGKGYLLMV
jgi:DNA-binding response OmpR family regulator